MSAFAYTDPFPWAKMGRRQCLQNPKGEQVFSPHDFQDLQGVTQWYEFSQIIRSGHCGIERSMASGEWPRATESCSVVASVQRCQGSTGILGRLFLMQDLGHVTIYPCQLEPDSPDFLLTLQGFIYLQKHIVFVLVCKSTSIDCIHSQAH